MTSKDDLAVLQQTMPTGVEGLRALEKFTREGNAEVRKLLYDEADVMLECRYCRNIFRSVINFISHKRAFCRASHVAVMLANQGVIGDEEARLETATKKRTGQMTSLTRRIEQNLVPIGDTPEMLALYTLPRVMKELPTTTFADGFQKVIGSLPANLAQKELLPEDRVCLTMPQDNSSRYKEMSLRARKSQNADKQQHRDFSSAEIKIIENFEKQDVRCGDFVELKCDHPSCSHLRPFHSLQALAYHCSLWHTKAFATESGDERWPCLLCFRHMWTLEGVHTHLLRVHPNVKEAHLKRRADEERAKPGRKPMAAPTRRARSLSMDVSGAGAAAAKPTTIMTRRGSRGGSRALSQEVDTEEDDDEDDEDEEEQEEMIIEEEDTRGRRRSARRAGGSAAQPLQLQPAMERQSRGRSSANLSDDYGDPPVLHSALDECGLEEEADEEDDDEPLTRKQLSQSVTPDSVDRDESEEKEKEKEMKEVKKEEEEEEEQEEVEDDPKYNSVERVLSDMLDTVCEVMSDHAETKKQRSKKSASITPPSRATSVSKRRGRPPGTIYKKSDEERITPKLGRPFKKVAEAAGSSAEPQAGTQPQPRVKRQYVRKSVKEAPAVKEERESASSEHSDPSSSQPKVPSPPAVEESRPARQRKRPRWMMNGDEVYDEGSRREEPVAAVNQALADESEEEDAQPKEEIKKKKPTATIAPSSTSSILTPTKMTLKNPHYSSEERRKLKAGPIGAQISSEVNDVLLFTPRSGKAVMERKEAAASSSSRKRKQNLDKLADETEEIMIVSSNDRQSGTKRSDLASVPVYLSEHQQNIFFSGLHIQKDSDGKTFYQCMYCLNKLPNIRDGRRHMVAHLRVMRLRCALCNAGAFFCIDMRNHLQMRGCPELHKAPQHMIRHGTPCMTKEHADQLTYVAHAGSPGRALFTSGKIVSILDNKPYLPDPVIEEKILGPTRVPPPNSSPRKPPHKFVMASAMKETKAAEAVMPVLPLEVLLLPADAVPAVAAAVVPPAPPPPASAASAPTQRRIKEEVVDMAYARHATEALAATAGASARRVLAFGGSGDTAAAAAANAATNANAAASQTATPMQTPSSSQEQQEVASQVFVEYPTSSSSSSSQTSSSSSSSSSTDNEEMEVVEEQ